MRHWKLGIAVLASALAIPPGADGRQDGEGAEARKPAVTLDVGDPTPPLAVADWVKVKGEPIERLDPEGTYVVEFWATWCGPCIGAIPHLTELAHKYRDQGVRFVGVDVWEDDPEAVRKFVAEEMGDKMDYDVALDTVPEGAVNGEGVMAKSWLRAAGQAGIPATFVVQGGKVAWIGHPMGLDEPLAKIVAGEWDLDAAAEAHRAARARQEEFDALMQRVHGPARRGDWTEVLSAIDAVVVEKPEMAGQFDYTRLNALLGLGRADEAVALVETLVEKAGDSAAGLNNLAWTAIDPDREGEPDPRLVALALKSARRAFELSGDEEPMILDTYAWALYRSGNAAEAVEIMEKVIRAVEAQVPDPDHPALKPYRDRLDLMKKAADGEKGPDGR